MTAVLVVAAFTLGTAAGTAGMYRTMRHLVVRCDRHDYRKIYLAEFKAKDIVANADHEHRLRLRIEASTAELRDSVGDLLDTVQAKDRQIARLCRRRYPLNYGINQ